MLVQYDQPRPLRELYFELGRALFQQGQHEQALASLNQALESQGQLPLAWEIHFLLGTVYDAHKAASLALRHYLTAAAEEPATCDQLIPFAQNLVNRDTPIADLHWILQEWANNLNLPDLDDQDAAEVSLLLARANLYAGRYQQCFPLFERSQAVWPQDPRILEGLGEANWRMGNHDFALMELQQAAALAANDHHPERLNAITLKLAQLLEDRGDYTQALQLIKDKLQPASPFYNKMRLIMGRSYLGANHAQAALDTAVAILQSGPDSPELEVETRLLQIQAFLALQRYDEALDTVNIALENKPGHPTLTFQRIQALVEGQIDQEQAVRLLRRYVDHYGLADFIPQFQRLRQVTWGQSGNTSYFLALGYFQVFKLLSTLNDSSLQQLVQAVMGSEPQRELADLVSAAPQDGQAAPESQTMPSTMQRMTQLLSRALVEVGRLSDQTKPLLSKWLLTRALEKVEQALEVGMEGQATYPQIPAWQLKGDILAALNRAEEAGQALLEAGRHAYWQGDYDTAVTHLQAAAQCNDRLAQPYWYLADIYRVRANTSDPPHYIDFAVAQQGVMYWEEGIRRQLPDKATSWVYLARARLCELLSRRGDEGAQDQLWQALVCLEKALLLEPEARRWARLAQTYRYLNADINALYAIEQAVALDAAHEEVIAERAPIYINVGQYDQALTLVDQLQEQDGETARPFYDGWRAIIYTYQERHQEALACIQNYLEMYPTDLWGREVHAAVLDNLERWSEARSDYEWIASKQEDPDYQSYTLSFASAAYNLGDVDTAITLAQSRLAEWPNRRSAIKQLLLYWARRGDWKQAHKHFDEALRHSVHRQHLDSLRLDIEGLARAARREAWPHAAELEAHIANWRQAVNHKLQALADWPLQTAVSPIEELEDILTFLDGREDNDTWLAVQAGIARLYTAQQDMPAAVHLYTALTKHGLFPEAQLGLAHIQEQRMAAVISALQARQFTHALALADRLRDTDWEPPPAAQAALETLAGSAYVGLDNDQAAQDHFYMALQKLAHNSQVEGATGEATNPGTALATLCLEALPDLAHFWQLWAAWQTMQATGDAYSAYLAAALEAGQHYLNQRFHLMAGQNEASSFLTAVTPIAVEAAIDLIPDDTSTDTWRLFTDYIPAMRARLKEAVGVTVPGVRVRSNDTDMPLASYLIMLDEIPLVLRYVEPDKSYCPASPETLAAVGIVVAKTQERPDRDAPGCWLEPAEAAQVQGLDVWDDHWLYIMHHVEALLRQNLPTYVGVQEVADLLAEYREAGGADLVAAALPDQTAVLRFGRLLRALLAEQVSIAPWQTILETVQQTGLPDDDGHDVLRQVRRRLATYLPGNQPGDQRVPVPAAVEQEITRWLVKQNDKHFFAIPPEQTQELLETIRELVAEHDEDIVLMTESADVRPFLRRLVELEFPHLLVIAREEVRDQPPDSA